MNALLSLCLWTWQKQVCNFSSLCSPRMNYEFFHMLLIWEAIMRALSHLFFHKNLVKTTRNGDFFLEDCWLLISLVWWTMSTSCCLFPWVWGLCLLFVCFIISVHFCILSKMWNFKYSHSHFPFNYLFL